MRRSSFRSHPAPTNGHAQPYSVEPSRADAIEKSILASVSDTHEGLSAALNALKADISSLRLPPDDISVPADLAKSLKLVHARLDRLESLQKEVEAQALKAQTAFSNALLTLTGKIEKISGGEDSKFSLAHTLEELIRVMRAPKSIKRDAEGNMNGWTVST